MPLQGKAQGGHLSGGSLSVTVVCPPVPKIDPMHCGAMYKIIKTMYSLLHLKCHLISVSNLNLFGLFSTECGTGDLNN